MRRWTSAYHFAWKPIITFGTRRLALLEWVEEELDPTAFSDTGNQLGLALDEPGVRMTIRRDGVEFADTVASDDGVSSLLPILDGVFRFLEPKGVVLMGASTAWSAPVAGLTYDESRARYASGMSGLARDGLFQAVDTSALADVEAGDYSGQVEWGIVEPSELHERIEAPRLGRLSSLRPDATIRRERMADLPDASIFVDCALRQEQASPLDDREGMESAINLVTGLSEYVADAISADVLSKVGDTQ